LESWRKQHPKLAEWAKTAAAESLTVFDFPVAHRMRLRASGGADAAGWWHPPQRPIACGCAPAGLARINRELRRRTRINCFFPNPDSCLRLVFALLAELDDEPDPQGLSQLQPVTRTS